MKSLKLSFKVVALALMACVSGFATAADSTGLAVTANVPGLCKFSTTTTPLAFGAVDPSLTADKVVSANVNYKCTKNTASLGVTTGSGPIQTMIGPTPTDTMSYTLALAGGTQTGKGFGPGQDLVLAVTGTITAAQYQNAAAGAYSEIVTLTITN